MAAILQMTFLKAFFSMKTCAFRLQFHWSLFSVGTQFTLYLQWNLYNETEEVSLKTHKFHHLSGTVFTKLCLFSLPSKTTCVERPQDLVVALYRFHCTLVQVIAWCHLATSHYLNQCCLRYLSPYGIARPQWVNSLTPWRFGCYFEFLSNFQTHIKDRCL